MQADRDAYVPRVEAMVWRIEEEMIDPPERGAVPPDPTRLVRLDHARKCLKQWARGEEPRPRETFPHWFHEPTRRR